MALTRVYGNLVTSGTITGSLFQANTITGDIIGQSAVSTNNITDGTITGNKIATTTITGDKIAVGTITSNLLSSTISISRIEVDNLNTKSVFSNHYSFGTVSGSATINVAQSSYFSANTTANTTWQFTGAPDSSKASGFVLELTSGGTYVQTWPAAVKWPGGTAPTLTSGATSVDLLVFVTDNGGTIWRGSLAQANSA